MYGMGARHRVASSRYSHFGKLTCDISSISRIAPPIADTRTRILSVSLSSVSFRSIIMS
jgi:hypothetical protein